MSKPGKKLVTDADVMTTKAHTAQKTATSTIEDELTNQYAMLDDKDPLTPFRAKETSSRFLTVESRHRRLKTTNRVGVLLDQLYNDDYVSGKDLLELWKAIQPYCSKPDPFLT